MEEGTLEENLEEDLIGEYSEDDEETEEESGDSKTEDEEEKGKDEEGYEEEQSIGKIRLGVASSSFSSSVIQAPKRGGLEKEIFVGDDVWGGAEDSLDLVEEKYKTEDRERDNEDSVKYGAKENNFYDGSSKNHYDEKSLSRGEDDFEIEIDSRQLDDRKGEEFYSLREKEKSKDSNRLFDGGERTYFERKEKEYLA
jgi:hypothetical protein